MAAKKGTKPPAKEVETAETDEVEVTKDQLLALGAEMNTLLFPGEEVDFTEMDEDGILEQIKADAGSIDPGDQFSDESKATLAAIGVDIEWTALAPAPPKASGKGKAEKKAAEPKVKKEKAPSENDGINAFFTGLPDTLTAPEDEIVVKAKVKFPEKPYRVIGNALYAFRRKAAK